MNSIIKATTNAAMIPHNELTIFSGIKMMESKMMDASVKKEEKDSLSLVCLAMITMTMSTPPVEPPPRNVKATPVPTNTPAKTPHKRMFPTPPSPETKVAIW